MKYAQKISALAIIGLLTVLASSAQIVSGASGTAGASGSGAMQLSPVVRILTTSLPNGIVGVSYGVTLRATGGKTPYSWKVISGSLPGGLTLSSSGTISGVPTNNAAVYPFTVQVTDSSVPAQIALQPLSITIQCPQLSMVSTSPLPTATLGSQYQNQMQSSGGIPPITWSLTGGSLPPGETLAPGGLVSGIPTLAGNFSFTIKASDSCSTGSQSVSGNFTEQVNSNFAITTQSPVTTAIVGQPFSFTFSVVGGTAPYTWTVPAGPIPTGAIDVLDYMLMPLSTRNNFHLTGQTYKAFRVDGGMFWWLKGNTGNPWDGELYDANSVYHFFTEDGDSVDQPKCQANGYPSCYQDPFANKTFQTPVPLWPRYFNVNGPPVTTTTNGLNPIIRTVNCGQDGQPPINIGNIQGTLQNDGLMNWGSLGSNIPTLEGDYFYGGSVPGVYNNREQYWFAKGFGQVQWQLSSWNGTGWTIQKTTNSLTLASGGAPTPNFGCNVPNLPIKGTVPPGIVMTSSPQLDLVDSTGVLSGTANTAGTYNYTVQVEDTNGNIAQKQFTQVVACAALSITTTALPNAGQNKPYQFQMIGSGGNGALTWTATGLPAGLAISSAGLISGTPTVFGNFSVTVTLTDSCPGGPQSVNQTYSLTVTPATQTLTFVTTSPLPDPVVGQAYTFQMQATGGIPPYVWAVINNTVLPPGLSLDPNTGIISGTPTSSGVFNPDIQVHDTQPVFIDQVFQMTVDCPGLTITNQNPLPSATLCIAYSNQMTSSGGVPPISWSATGLPPGLSISQTGIIAGTPSGAGAFTPSITATDSCQPTGTSITQQFNLTVNGNVAITTTSPLPSGIVTQQYSVTFTASGGVPPYNWTLILGSLPTGLTLTGAGVLSGVPSQAGTYTFTVQVADSAGNTASGIFVLTITANTGCGPPTYSCSRTDLTVAPNPAVPPNVGPNNCVAGQLGQCGNETGAGNIVTDPDFNNRILRVTDANTNASHTTMLTDSSGSDDANMWNHDSTYFLLRDPGTVGYLYSFNKTTFQSTFCITMPAMTQNSGWSWSYTNPAFLFRMNQTTIYKYDLTNYPCGQPAPSPTVVFNFASDGGHCLDGDPNWTANPVVTTRTLFTLSTDDQYFESGFSNAGGQGTGFFSAVYNATKGCIMLDTANNANGGIVYGDSGWGAGALGTIPIPDRWTFHDNSIVKDGSIDVVGFKTCFIMSCYGSPNGGIPYYWVLSQKTFGEPTACTGGHKVMGHTLQHSITGCTHKGDFLTRPFANITNAPVTHLITNYPPGINGTPNFDGHFSWSNIDSADTNCPVGATFISSTNIVAAWENEILCTGITPTGPVKQGTVVRFAHTFSEIHQNFNTEWSIGHLSQDGKYFLFASDWLGTLGLVGTNVNGTACVIGVSCRGDVFIVELR